MKAGTKINVKFLMPEGDVEESAVVCRTTKAMGPLPDGYVPVRFAKDGARVLVHQSMIKEAA